MTTHTPCITRVTSALLIGLATTALAQPPAGSSSPQASVTLALTEYNRLVDAAARATPAAPPVPAVVATATLDVRVDDGAARGRFRLAGAALQAGVGRVRVLTSGAIVDARTNGTPVPLIADGQDLAALVTGPGPLALDLDWGAPVRQQPGRASFVLPVPHAGAARATLDVPGDASDLKVSPGLVTARVVSAGRTRVEVTLDPGANADVSWTTREATRMLAATPGARLLADVNTIVTITDAEVRMAALVSLAVSRGSMPTFAFELPRGYTLTGLTSPSIETREVTGAVVQVTVHDPSATRHHLLLTLERGHTEGVDLATELVRVRGAHRERGELAIEGVGTLELSAPDRADLKRMDVREVGDTLLALARSPLLAAFRYQRTIDRAAPELTCTITRFPDADVVPAAADYAHATTMITSEGRALTEVRLRLVTRTQPFLRVGLPAGASLVSAELDGAPIKPVAGVDGVRLPIRGARGVGGTEVSFVYLHGGAAFGKKGTFEMALPQLDVPVSVASWEVFVPEQYSARPIGGTALAATMFDRDEDATPWLRDISVPVAPDPAQRRLRIAAVNGGQAGQIRGSASDTAGGLLPGVTITLSVAGFSRSVVTDERGQFVLTGVPHGNVTLSAELAGFRSQQAIFAFGEQPLRVDFVLEVGALAETVTVTGVSPKIERQAAITPPSEGVVALQQRVAGVLPIRVDVPRAGRSHRFISTLVVDEAPSVTLRYRRR